MMNVLEIFAPFVLALTLGQTVDMGDVEIRAMAPMECAVRVTAQDGQALEASVKLGVVNANSQALHGLCVTRFNISDLDVRAVRGAINNGVVIYQEGEFGVFANRISIGSIRHNGQNGVLIVSPTGGVYGVQGNLIKIGQMIFNNHSGMAIFGRESAWNNFTIGVSEWNGLYGIYDDGRENIFTVTNTNTNGIIGFKSGHGDKVIGFFSDGGR